VAVTSSQVISVVELMPTSTTVVLVAGLDPYVVADTVGPVEVRGQAAEAVRDGVLRGDSDRDAGDARRRRRCPPTPAMPADAGDARRRQQRCDVDGPPISTAARPPTTADVRGVENTGATDA
jgi:hypothetical protein